MSISSITDPAEPSAETRTRILDAAAALIAADGAEGATTRAIAAAAAVQAPAIYRLFGDKQGLLEAVAAHVMAHYVASKAGAGQDDDDPLLTLERSWREHIAFGLGNPALYGLMYRTPASGPVASAGQSALVARVRAVARTGRLRISEARAVGLLQATGTGTVMTLITQRVASVDDDLVDTAWQAVAGLLFGVPEIPASGPLEAAVTLRARLDEADMLSTNERLLLTEWLDRIAAG